ncbi:MAG: hypothetical protein ACE5EE_08885 [Fidelibacterota bacterium]
MRKIAGIVSCHVLVLLIAVPGMAQEHPKEHPSEHPQEHPVSLSTKAVSKENLAAAVKNHVMTVTAENGAFTFTDDIEHQVLNLKLLKVHDDKLAALGDHTYFACADFEAEDGTTYDLDIFMKGEAEEDLQPVEVTLHKKDGTERYTWMEVEGIWHRVEVTK